MHGIICTQTLVKTYVDEYKTKAATQANTAFQDFIQELHGLDRHPLREMLHEYKKAKQSAIQLRSRIKYLNSDLKRKKDSLWNSVKKEVTAKGKCEDGYTVNVSHSFIIKELDDNKFNELKRTLKEIEDSVSLDAFNSYMEKLVKRRIERYLFDFLKEDSQTSEDKRTISRADLDSLKKCISILFDTQRENAPDTIYIETSRKWLHNLVIKLLGSERFQENIFIMNHVLRCPNGIENWAAYFVQIPFDICESDKSEGFDCCCARKFLLVLLLLLNPIPHREAFLKSLNDSDSSDLDFTVIDSDGEEEETCTFSRNWSEDDILSLLKQIPLRILYKHLLLDMSENEVAPSEEKMLKVFAYSTAVVDILFTGMETYDSEKFPKLFDYLSNLIRHIVLYISKYWDHQGKFNVGFKLSLQAVYDKFFFHIIYEVHKKLNNWRILSHLPFEFISNKMLWNIIWVFSNSGSEEEIFSEKDIERKIKDDSIQLQLINQVRESSPQNSIHLLNALEKIALSNNREDDFLRFLVTQIFQITFVDKVLRETLSKEGCEILSSIMQSYPNLVSVLLKEIEESEDAANHSIALFKKVSLLHWIPEDADVCILSSWLLSNSLCEGKSNLARVIIAGMNWNFNEEGSLSLPLKLHKRMAMLVAEAYMKFDSSANEWVVSRGIKQMLQFTNIVGQQRNEEGFVHWAWNILFSLKLHPLDRKYPPWISIYDGSIDASDANVTDDISGILLTDFENKHPCICYLIIVMTDVGHNIQKLMKTGLDCLASLIESQQYMAAIRSLYYVLPFFVKNPELLLDEFRFLQIINDLITADMGVLSSFTSEPVIGTVLHNLAAMMKHQIHQASESTVECAVPLLKLWIKVLMKILHHDKSSKNKFKYSVKQIYFLLDILMKISYMHSYTRDCTLELLHTICNTSNLPVVNQTFWRRMFSSQPMYTILNQNTVPEYPVLAWYILSSEVKQKNVVDLWTNVQNEMLKQKDISVLECLKKASNDLKIDQPPLECLPIYRWAHQVTDMSPSHPISPLLWQQFFIYFFQGVQLPNSQVYTSIGMQYFKYGSYIELMDRMKKQLLNSVQYYRDFLKKSGFQDVSSPQKAESVVSSETDSIVYRNILKVFSAFQLWINDESLHDSKLCLSALEPKYCPDRLQLILKGDQDAWFDLVPNTFIKDEFEQKFKLWHVTKFFEHESKIVSKSETLPKQILRHIESYENPVSDVNYLPLNTVHSINDTSLSSTDELLQLIETNQSVIFGKARHFTEQMKKMKQLNFNFNNWVPQEYRNEDLKVTKRKECHKGTGENGCSGAASFILQIQKYIKNERISERMDNNRADFVILQDQLTKLSVNDLCDASLLIETYIRELSRKMKAAKYEEASQLKKTGVALFYHQINAIEKIAPSVAEYSPSRLFFSSIIYSLGEEFIHGNDLELQELAKTILNHPEAGNLALNLFNPNKSSSDCFLRVYETLTSAIGKYSPSTLLSLFSKIDFTEWLKDNNPTYNCRKEIYSHICNALLSCGSSPSVEIYPIFEILKKHFKIVLLYMFPELFHETICFLLKGISNQNLSNDVFYEAFFCFGCPLFNEKTSVEDIELGLKKFAQNQQLPANQQMFVSSAQLNLMQVKYASNALYHQFINKPMCYELYSSYSLYIRPVGILLAILSHSVVALQLDDILIQTLTLVLPDLWEEFHSPFSPWLHPFENSGTISFPWSDKEVEMAQYMFQVFNICLKYFHQQLFSSNSEESVLSYLWTHYMKTYVEPGYRHYSFSLYHSEIQHLPWHQFYPSPCDIEGMCKVLQSDLDESKQFLSKISLKIPWLDVMKSISVTKSPHYVAKVLATLGKLLIISQLNSSESEENLHPNVFKNLESLYWHYLSVEDVGGLLSLYYANSEPIISEKKSANNPEFHTFQFLKLICCMSPNVNGEEYSNSKRVLFLQQYVSALSVYLSKKDTKLKPNELKEILPGLLSQIDNVICNGVDPEAQINYALPLVKETVMFLNNLSGNEVAESTVLKSLNSWLNANNQSPLLLPCLKISCSLNAIPHIVSLSECCISARFSNETIGSCNARSIWQLISSFFQVPTRLFDEFIKSCIEQNSFLALYCHIISIIPQCTTVGQKKDLLQKMILWIKESNLRAYGESKILLLWDKILELSVTLVFQGENMVVKQELMSFCYELGILAEDRANSGILSVIGFGPVSALSVNFRFLCRLMSAFILCQIPDNSLIRIEPISPGHFNPADIQKNDTSSKSNFESSSTSALKALENLKGLLKKKSYTALYSQVDYAMKCILDPKYNLSESRKILKYFAVTLYPKESYLTALDS